jgi:hypothetical protein
MTTTRTGTLCRTLYYVLTGGVAIIFLFPLLWSLGASVSPQASTGQVNGFGPGKLHHALQLRCGAGPVSAQQRARSAPYGRDHCGGVDLWRVRFRPAAWTLGIRFLYSSFHRGSSALTVIRDCYSSYHWKYARGFLQGFAPDVDVMFVDCFGVVADQGLGYGAGNPGLVQERRGRPAQ